jgi:hypothetical protein
MCGFFIQCYKNYILEYNALYVICVLNEDAFLYYCKVLKKDHIGNLLTVGNTEPAVPSLIANYSIYCNHHSEFLIG